MMQIKPLNAADYAHWLPLWDENNMGRHDPAVTAQTWQRLIEPGAQMGGLAAWEGEDMIGLLHYILHPVTGHLQPACYMQDVYVRPGSRQRGAARQLIETLNARGAEQGWARIYWLAERDNEAAQALYKTIGVKLDFTLHVIPL